MAKAKSKKYAGWVIIGLLFVGLLGFGAGGLSGSIRNIGSVGDKPISVAQYQRALNSQIRAFEAQVGSPVSFVQAQALGLDRQVLNTVVAERTLDNEAAQLGISAGDERVRQEVLQVPGFRGLSGNFDREAYRSALQRSGQTEAEFETSIREEVARTLLQGAVVDGISAPPVYAETLAKYIGETRAITWATIRPDDLTEPVPGPTDDDIQTYYDENPDTFTAPEQREITYAWMTPAMLQDDVTLDDDAVRALYDERFAEFVRPERRLVERIVFGDQEQVDAALAQLADGTTDFEGLITARGLAVSDADMGDVSEDDLGAAGEAVFAANPGDVVGPFPTDFGPALFRMNAVLAADETTFEEAEPQLREELAAARARRVIEDARENINDLLAGGARMEDLVEQTNMEIGTITWSPENRDGIAAYESFQSAAAAISEGDFPELFDLADGGIFTLRLDGVTPPAVRPLEAVRDNVAAAWQAARTQQAVMEQAETAATAISEAGDFAGQGLVRMSEDGLTRRSFVDGTPPGFIQQVFALEPGEVTTVDAETFAIVLQLDDVTVPDADDPALSNDLEVVSKTASAGIAQDVFDIFNNALQRETDVTINQQAVTAVHSAFQ